MAKKDVYLLLYNFAQLVLWSSALTRLLSSTLATRSMQTAYHAVRPFVNSAQMLAWLEVIHAALGLGGAVPTAFIQCMGRYVVLMFVVDRISDIQNHVVTLLLLFSWSLADIARYSYYIANIVAAHVPYPILWLRYSFFVVLYPIGIVAEWLIYYLTLQHVDETRIYSIAMPNKYNFAFDFGTWNRIILLLYFYFGPFMYLHMLRQRRKKIKGNPT